MTMCPERLQAHASIQVRFHGRARRISQKLNQTSAQIKSKTAPAAKVAVFACMALLLEPALRAQPHSQQSPNELMRQVVNHELKANDADKSHWLYISRDGIKHQTEAIIETPQGTLSRQIANDGKALDVKQEEAEDARIEKLISNPEALQKMRQNEQNDNKQTEQLFKMLPNAWTYKIASRSGDTMWLDFTPNPNFNPPDYQSRALHAMNGTVEINTSQLRLISISGRLMKDVKFGWFGILGHLQKGGTFRVHQAEVGPDIWRITQLTVDMNGKALFFKTISVHQDDERSHFERVPDDLTLQQAANRLREIHYPL